MNTRNISKQAILNTSIIFLISSALLGVGSRTFADSDLWGHLRFGLDMIESGGILHVDRYSYLSEGQAWINHELMSELLFAAAWIAGNVTGLILLKTTMMSG